MVLKKALQLLSVCFLMFINSSLLAAMWYVAPPPLGNNKNPGTQEHPFATIQRGIDSAAGGDTVIVAQGTYVENINFKGKNIVLRSTDPSDWSAVAGTIIDGNWDGSVVTFTSTEDETCVISGFTLRNGSGTFTVIGGEWGQGPGGGGIFGGHMWNHTHATVQNNLITGNGAWFGGALFGVSGSVRNNVIVNNSASLFGTVALCFGLIENNLIVGNSAAYGGGGLAHCAAVRNSTVVANSAPLLEGAGLWHIGVTPYGPPGGSITNCIIWGNTSPTGPQVYDSLTPTYSCIQDWTGGGTGNIALDPRFVDPDGPDNDPATYEDNNYHLMPDSPCIDASLNEDWMSDALDLDGNPRILAGISSLTVDIGAYEFKFCVAGITLTSPAGSPELRWHSRQRVRYGVWSCTDLAAAMWNSVAAVTSAGDETTWTDSDAASMLKFYRVEIK